MSSVTLKSPTKRRSASAKTKSVNCPHCKKAFSPKVDADQPLRLQGAKCPNCRLFVPARAFVK